MLVALLGACGDNASPCDYTETDDGSNDLVAEMTGLTVTDHQAHVCGAFDGGHPNAALGIIDVDTYQVDVETAGPLLVEITGDDASVNQLSDIAVQFVTTATPPEIVALGHYNPALSGHGAYITPMTAGTYDMQVILYSSAALSGSIGYRVRLAPMPACAALTSPDYSEASDATNGAIAVSYTENPTFTMIAGDTPEDSHQSIRAGHSFMIAGSAGSTPGSDQYLDRDTYSFTTDDTTNELAVRLDWQGSASDLDYIVFEANTLTPVIASNTTSTMEGELAEFGVMPNATYWLWIGAFQGSQPTPYAATVCGQHFFY